MSILKFIFTLVVFFGVGAHSSDVKVAVITSMTGKVEVFSEAPTEAKENLVLFNNKKFLSKIAKVGLKVNPGEILRTGADGKLKVIYSTGDVIILGSSSALTVPSKTAEDQAPKMDLIYGKVRGMVEKGGPLTGLQIKTKSIVSGVRGTDLFVSYNPGSNTSEVHVIRGEVAVAKINDLKENQILGLSSPEAKIIKTGQVALVTPPLSEDKSSAKKEEGEVKIKASTQQDLKQIQVNTTLSLAVADLKQSTTEEKKEIEQLEAKATTMVLEDIKKTTPEVLKKVDIKNVASTEQLGTAALDEVAKTAPKGSSKPKQSDFENDADVYKKFFKPATEK